jgi:aconitase B
MRVTNDVHSRLESGRREVQQLTQGKGEQAKTRLKPRAAQVSQQGSGLRNISNAMTIMHKAQLIVQRALTVSNRLQNLALTSFGNNSPDVNQIGTEISTINAELSEFGVSVSSPPVTETIQLDSTREDLVLLQQMNDSGRLNSEQIQQITNNLNNRAGSIDRAISDLNQQYGINTEIDTAAIENSIRANPSDALAVQGNIRPEAVTGLT